MIDFMAATQEAFFKRLDAGVELAEVFDHIPQGTEPNFVKIGMIESTNEGTKDEPRWRYEVEVHTIYRGADRAELFAIMHQVAEALDDQQLEAVGVEFSTPELLSAAASDAGPDGVTYAGISIFEVCAEAA